MTGYDELDNEAPSWERRERALKQAPDADAVVRAQQGYLEEEIRNAEAEIRRIRAHADARVEPIIESVQHMRDQLIRITPQIDGP